MLLRIYFHLLHAPNPYYILKHYHSVLHKLSHPLQARFCKIESKLEKPLVLILTSNFNNKWGPCSRLLCWRLCSLLESNLNLQKSLLKRGWIRSPLQTQSLELASNQMTCLTRTLNRTSSHPNTRINP